MQKALRQTENWHERLELRVVGRAVEVKQRRKMSRRKAIFELTENEYRLLESLAGESKTTKIAVFRRFLVEKGMAATPLLTGEELKDRLAMLEDIDNERRVMAERRRLNIQRGNDRHWDEKTGLDTETRKRQQREVRLRYQREWARKKRLKDKE